MRLKRSQNRILELLSTFVTQVKGAVSVNQTDICHVSETILVPLMRDILGYRQLRNLNETERINFPGIDLADDKARVAVQVTATSDGEKIKDTLRQFVNQGLNNKYDRLIIYILTERQRSYSDNGFKKIIGNRFRFDPKADILDYRNLYQKACAFQLDEAQRIENFLESNFGSGQRYFTAPTQFAPTQPVYLNLLVVSFPNKLYAGEVAYDREEIIRNSAGSNLKLRYNSSARDVVRAALEQNGLRFGVDWVIHNNQIVTFHDLGRNDVPLASLVDQGTIGEFDTDRYWGINQDYENVFKQLLGRCLQQKLFHRGVQWQNEDKMYIFGETEGLVRENGIFKRKVLIPAIVNTKSGPT
jgi:hypothetical protein